MKSAKVKISHWSQHCGKGLWHNIIRIIVAYIESSFNKKIQEIAKHYLSKQKVMPHQLAMYTWSSTSFSWALCFVLWGTRLAFSEFYGLFFTSTGLKEQPAGNWT